jgi:hypothetical protein
MEIPVVRTVRAPWKIYTILSILLIASPVIFFEWVRHWPRVEPGMPASEPNSWIAARSDSRMQQAAAFKPVMDVQVIAEAEPRASLYDLPVELSPVGVRSAPDAGGFWASQVRTEPVFVAFAANVKRVSVKWRDSVDVTGHIRKLPAREEIERRWPGVKGQDLQRLLGQGVYVEADEVSVNGPF